VQSAIYKKIKPVTPALRGLKIVVKPVSLTKKSLKNQKLFIVRKSGRNNTGSITIRHKGNGQKRLYRMVDFCRKTSYGIVQALEYDPYRKAFLARIFNNRTKNFFYVLAPKNICVGSVIDSGVKAEIKLGHALPFSKIPVGSLVHNVSVSKEKIGQYVRAAGTYGQLLQKTKTYGRIRLSSGEQRFVPLTASATLGVVSNENAKLGTIGKAGRSRWKGIRPSVRGVAMNPVDHPHGGGEGKTSGGRPSVTPWGKPTRGPKTSRSSNKFIIVSRKKN
jgi:large subunit ribosomal protein L2